MRWLFIYLCASRARLSSSAAFPVQKKSGRRHLAQITTTPVLYVFVRRSVVSDFVKSRFAKKLVKTWSASWKVGCAAVCQCLALPERGVITWFLVLSNANTHALHPGGLAFKILSSIAADLRQLITD